MSITYARKSEVAANGLLNDSEFILRHLGNSGILRWPNGELIAVVYPMTSEQMQVQYMDDFVLAPLRKASGMSVASDR